MSDDDDLDRQVEKMMRFVDRLFGNGESGAVKMEPKQFWDDVFTGKQTGGQWVADHKPEYFFKILNLVEGPSKIYAGPGYHAGVFQAEFARAQDVLDVGPGYGRLLDASDAKTKLAIEISAENRHTLEQRGIRTIPPGVLPPLVFVESIDLAWSVSCFPHCTPQMQSRLLYQVYSMLRPGGVFYLEHVNQKPFHPDCPEEIKLPAGRYFAAPGAIAAQWLSFESKKSRSSLSWVSREIGDDNCPLIGWVGRFEKGER